MNQVALRYNRAEGCHCEAKVLADSLVVVALRTYLAGHLVVVLEVTTPQLVLGYFVPAVLFRVSRHRPIL